MTSPPRPYACRRCRKILQPHADPDRGLTFRHTVSTHADGHRPDPAPASDVVNVAWACDLCADPYPVECFTSDPVRMIAIGDDIERVDDLGDTWLACITCAEFLTDRDAAGLSAHATSRIALPASDLGVTTMRPIQLTVISSLLPDRTLVTDVRWPHTPIAARALPRVRDRLVALLRGLIGIPGLDDARRRRIADATYGAAMFCVDGEATEEATAAAETLSGARLTADLVLAAHGMLIWSAEIGGHEAATDLEWSG